MGTLLNTASLNVEGEDQQRLKLEEKICVAMEGKEKRKKKEENKQKQATPENVHGKLKNPSGQVSFRSHVARIEMLLTFHRSVYGRQLRLLMKDCRAYSRRHRWSRTPSPPLQTHSACSREA